MSIQQLIAQAKEQGFSVYAPEKSSSYFYFSKDNKIGYCQYTNMRGVIFSTVHKAKPSTGTGFAADSFDDALSIMPPWASSNSTVIKYNSLTEFLEKHWQPLVKL